MMYVDKKEFEDKPIDKIVGQTMQVITGRITKKYEFKYCLRFKCCSCHSFKQQR